MIGAQYDASVTRTSPVRTWIFWGVVMAILCGVMAYAQNITFGTMKKFSIPDYYTGTDTKKSLLTGAQAVPQANGRVLIRQLRIESYDRQGMTNLVIEAPECNFDYGTRQAWSDGPLKITDGRGRFSMEGNRGFVWNQTNSNLVVSNQVKASIRKDAIQLYEKP